MTIGVFAYFPTADWGRALRHDLSSHRSQRRQLRECPEQLNLRQRRYELGSNAEGEYRNQSQKSLNVTLVVVVAFVLVYCSYVP